MTERHVSKLLVVGSVLFFFLLSGVAQADKKWHDRKDEGWFFYHEKVIPREPEVKPPAPQPAPDAQPAKPLAQIVKEKGEMLLGEAIVNPTEENVKAYMIYQKTMMDGSQRFAQTWERVLAKHPDLYLASHYSEDVSQDMRGQLRLLADKAGIFFFYSSTCPHCQKQVDTIRKLQSRYNFQVMAISVDGGVIPGMQDITVNDNGVSATMGVEQVPSIYLVYPNENRFEVISQGFLPVTDIERRIYNHAQMDSEINPVNMLELINNQQSSYRRP